jgi:hypothetical protein
MSRSAILMKVGLVNFIFFQLSNEGIHNIVTVPMGVESLREKYGSDCAPTRHSNLNTNLLIMQRRLVESMGIVCTPDTWVLTVDIPRQMEVCLVCEECDVQIVLSFTIKKV